MKTDSFAATRQLLARALDWGDAHATFEAAVEGLPTDLRGVRPQGLPHSAWELLEHLRLAQRDILDFCQPEPYHELKWPDEYWPSAPAPPDARAWDASVAGFRADREAFRQIALNTDIDLNAVVPHGTHQTYLRELLLVIDHNAYHIAQLILVRRALSAWPAG